MVNFSEKNTQQSSKKSFARTGYETQDNDVKTTTVSIEQYQYALALLFGVIANLASSLALFEDNEPELITTKALLISSLLIHRHGIDKAFEDTKTSYYWFFTSLEIK